MARGRNAGPGLVSLITVAVSSSVDRTSRVAPLRLVGRGVAGALLYVVLAAASADARPGDVDPSFGAGGFVSTDFGAEDAATDVAVQPDGRIVAVGAFSGDFTVARYRADGSLDPSFDGDGLARTGFGAVDAATSVAIQPDGKIVAAGFTGAGPSPRNFALVRYNANGSLDNGFDGDGMLFTDFGADDVGVDVAVGPGGTIVAAGGTASGTAVDFAFARYDATGAPDNSFDGDGLQTIDFGGLDGLTRAAIQADGRIVAAGLSDAGGDLDIAVARLTAVGAPDPSFDGDGRLTTDIDAFDIAHGVAVQPDGRIVVAGETSTGMGGGLAIVRYQPGGALDPSFGAGGVLIPNLGGQDSPSDVAIAAERQDRRPGRRCVRLRPLQPRRLPRRRVRVWRLSEYPIRRQRRPGLARPAAGREDRRGRRHRRRPEPAELRSRPPRGRGTRTRPRGDATTGLRGTRGDDRRRARCPYEWHVGERRDRRQRPPRSGQGGRRSRPRLHPGREVPGQRRTGPRSCHRRQPS